MDNISNNDKKKSSPGKLLFGENPSSTFTASYKKHSTSSKENRASIPTINVINHQDKLVSSPRIEAMRHSRTSGSRQDEEDVDDCDDFFVSDGQKKLPSHHLLGVEARLKHLNLKSTNIALHQLDQDKSTTPGSPSLGHREATKHMPPWPLSEYLPHTDLCDVNGHRRIQDTKRNDDTASPVQVVNEAFAQVILNVFNKRYNNLTELVSTRNRHMYHRWCIWRLTC